MTDVWREGDEIRARWWTYVDGPEGRWSLQRRGHRVTSTDPLRGEEFWYEEPKEYTEGTEHRLDPESAEPYNSRGRRARNPKR